MNLTTKLIWQKMIHQNKENMNEKKIEEQELLKAIDACPYCQKNIADGDTDPHCDKHYMQITKLLLRR